MGSVLYISRVRVLAILCAACWGVSASAGLFDDDEARKDIRRLRDQTDAQTRDFTERLQKLDAAIKSLGIIQLVNQIETQNSEIARLRGQIEVMTNDVDLTSKRQKDFYLDIDTRLRKLEAGGGIPASGGAPVGPSVGIGSQPIVNTPQVATNPALPPPLVLPPGTLVQPSGQVIVSQPATTYTKDQENRAYDVGSNAFRRGDFPAAIRAFETFIADFVGSGLAANAQYWIGISHFNLKDYPRSRAAHEQVLKRYPDSAKAPDALLAIASVQQETGDLGSARNTLADIISRYPGSEAATKARTRLAQLRR